MAISQFIYDTIERELNKVVELKDPKVIETAMKLSFYVAMVDAAEDDPMDDEDQPEMLEFFAGRIQELTREYQEIVNDLI